MNHRRIIFILLMFLAIQVHCAQALAQRVSLSNLVVDNMGGRIAVRFGVDPKPLEPLREALEEGGTLALECRAALSLKRDYVWNRTVSEGFFGSSLSQDSAKAYEVVIPGRRQERIRGKDLGLVLREAWGELVVDLGDWSLLTRGQAYVLDLEIRLVRQNVPRWKKNALFFWNFDVISPAKYQLDFSY